MTRIHLMLLAALLQSSTAFSAGTSIDFYFSNDALLERDGAAAIQEWTERCVAGGEFAEFAALYAPDLKMSVAERKAQLAKFDRAEAVRIATDAWREANAALPQGSLLVCIDLAHPADDFTRSLMGGISAVTAGRGRIILRVHPDANWKSVLPYVLAHEMHHSYWLENHFDASAPFTLADYLVFEGRADYFAGRLFTHRAPWTTALDADAYSSTWLAMSKDLGTTEWQKLQAFMFGSQPAAIPMWAGYSVGYRLVSERMAQEPRLDLKAMTSAPASAFVPKK
jgi:Predicted Zn-dependent protease (DUF2268)